LRAPFALKGLRVPMSYVLVRKSSRNHYNFL
jgi:hypothetical protein